MSGNANDDLTSGDVLCHKIARQPAASCKWHDSGFVMDRNKNKHNTQRISENFRPIKRSSEPGGFFQRRVVCSDEFRLQTKIAKSYQLSRGHHIKNRIFWCRTHLGAIWFTKFKECNDRVKKIQLEPFKLSYCTYDHRNATSDGLSEFWTCTKR